MDTLPPAVLVAGTGTAIGKTVISRALTIAVQRVIPGSFGRVAAIKPLETGCNPDPLDALALAAASGAPGLATAPGLYRARLPLAPYASTLAGEPPPPSIAELAATCRALTRGADFALFEGAGGLLVPIDAQNSFADLAIALAIPVLLVAPDRLGVLSDVLACVEAAHARELAVLAVILVAQPELRDDSSPRYNRDVLAERLSAPVLRFPRLTSSQLNDPDALTQAAHDSGLVQCVWPRLRT